MAMGRVLTGWTFPVKPGMSSQNHNPEYYGGPMVPVEGLHDSGAKTLLGQTIPAGRSAEADLAAAFNIVFNHPNIGPFVATQMIEHLVTSNPSPAYVQRVATAFDTGSFDGFGSGKRGDMQATIAAVLLDPEARRGDNPATVVDTDGKLREPVIMITSVARAFHARTEAANFAGIGDSMEQNVFYPGSVFNFFPPVNPIAGTTLNGPEFAIFDTNSSLARVNSINTCGLWLSGLRHHARFQPADQCRHIRPDGVVARRVVPAQQHAGPDEAIHPDGAFVAQSQRHDRPSQSCGLSLPFVFYVSGTALNDWSRIMTLHTRRDMLRLACCSAAGASLVGGLSKLGLVSALAQGASDYKALVCIFMFGGNDSNNMVVPNGQPVLAIFAVAQCAGAPAKPAAALADQRAVHLRPASEHAGNAGLF